MASIGLGEAAALLAALLWSLSSMLWGKVHLSPLGINLAKNTIGALLLLLTVAIISLINREALIEASWESVGWLGLSGLVGIVIGDTFFFRSLQILGPRLALMMATAAPMFSVFIGFLVLNEHLTFVAIGGVVLTIGGIAIVVSDRKARSEAPGLYPGTVLTGVMCGLGGAFCQSAGGALAKWGMTDCDALEATLIRTSVSFAFTVAAVAAQRRMKPIMGRLLQPATLKFIVPAAAMGTWLGVWLSQVAVKFSHLATANTLMATSPLFALPIVHFYFKQRATRIAVVGSIVAVAGVYLVAKESYPLQPEQELAPAVEKANQPDGTAVSRSREDAVSPKSFADIV